MTTSPASSISSLDNVLKSVPSAAVSVLMVLSNTQSARDLSSCANVFHASNTDTGDSDTTIGPDC
ncbi:hypothetical protein A5624_25810 [Mycobacterium sp. 1482292.6]|nr:hypothetical protein A5624_25810 [Mycobacterium sp. 1482292.6]